MKIKEGDIVSTLSWPERRGVVMCTKPVGCSMKGCVLVKWNAANSQSLGTPYIREVPKGELKLEVRGEVSS